MVAKGDCETVRVYHGEEIVAGHRRIWTKEAVSFDPVHYLALLERKPGALDFARPLEGWELPECFGVLRRRLEAAHGSEGTREYIAVLRLLEGHPLTRLTVAVERALELGCPRKELIGQYLYGENREVPVFRLEGREHLKLVRVHTTDPGDYGSLLGAATRKEEVA